MVTRRLREKEVRDLQVHGQTVSQTTGSYPSDDGTIQPTGRFVSQDPLTAVHQSRVRNSGLRYAITAKVP